MALIGRRVFSGSPAGIAALVVVAACSSSSNGNENTSTQPAAVMCANPGGAVAGPQDDHCGGAADAGGMVQETILASCYSDAAVSDDEGDDSGTVDIDGGPTGDCDPSEFGPSMYNQSGSDDDCKYNVEWTSTPICEGGNGVYFTVSATLRTNGQPLTGANPYIESVQACLHPSPNPPAPAVTQTEEGPPGTYRIGPIVFDTPGGSIIRFHFYGSCSDALDTSPHGHAAFFINVP